MPSTVLRKLVDGTYALLRGDSPNDMVKLSKRQYAPIRKGRSVLELTMLSGKPLNIVGKGPSLAYIKNIEGNTIFLNDSLKYANIANGTIFGLQTDCIDLGTGNLGYPILIPRHIYIYENVYLFDIIPSMPSVIQAITVGELVGVSSYILWAFDSCFGNISYAPGVCSVPNNTSLYNHKQLIIESTSKPLEIKEPLCH